jgi:hypothetical protein
VTKSLTLVGASVNADKRSVESTGDGGHLAGRTGVAGIGQGDHFARLLERYEEHAPGTHCQSTGITQTGSKDGDMEAGWELHGVGLGENPLLVGCRHLEGANEARDELVGGAKVCCADWLLLPVSTRSQMSTLAQPEARPARIDSRFLPTIPLR